MRNLFFGLHLSHRSDPEKWPVLDIQSLHIAPAECCLTWSSVVYHVLYSPPPYLHLATSQMWCWSGGRGILKKLFLCYSIVYLHNALYKFKTYLLWCTKVWAVLTGRSTVLGFDLAWFRSSVFMAQYRYSNLFLLTVHPSLYRLVSWAWLDWPLTWLTNHRFSVLWHCWLGHQTRKIIPEITYNVSSGMWNPAVPY